MQIIRGLRGLRTPIKGSVVTIGVFDGVHSAHKKVISEVVDSARTKGLKSVVVTFDPHPSKILNPKRLKVPALISLNHRIKLIGSCGVDFLIVLNFTKAIAGLSPEEFVKKILVDKLSARIIYVGGNFYFGRGGSADIKILKKLGHRFNFKTVVLRPIKMLGSIVSSSLIRSLILKGDIKKASRFLGRPVSILGTVVRGSKLARALGYPTANINPHHEVIPPKGVYAVKVRFGEKVFNGILNIGLRPTFYSPRDKEPTIEVHIFDFNNDIYGKDLEILFIKKIRDEIKFKGMKDLVWQIRRDESQVRSILP